MEITETTLEKIAFAAQTRISAGLAIETLWQAAQEHWPKINRDKTHLTFTEMLFVESLVLKEKLPSMEMSLAGAILNIAELTGEDTGLSLDERIELHLASSSFEMERIALKPIDDFVMGYGPRSDLLAVQRLADHG